MTRINSVLIRVPKTPKSITAPFLALHSAQLHYRHVTRLKRLKIQVKITGEILTKVTKLVLF
jgi:hypothetical protein